VSGYDSMTKSLILNCSLDRSAKVEELIRAVEEFSECAAVQFRDIGARYEVEKDVNAVVISGSKARIVNSSHRAMFKDVVDLIKRLDLPTLSVCFGHQLLCWSLGCDVSSLAEPVIDRFEEVRVLEVDELFDSFRERQTMPLVESHYDYVLKDSLDPAGFVLLADSLSCEVEAVSHRHSPFYGVQFHPERIEIEGRKASEGRKVIENFYQNVVKR
jgi:GMP synthase-like glutamine amidotransferase